MCKAGFTQQIIEKGANNRIEQVEKQVKDGYIKRKQERMKDGEKFKPEDASTLVALRIGAVDTTLDHDTEKRIRWETVELKKRRLRNSNYLLL